MAESVILSTNINALAKVNPTSREKRLQDVWVRLRSNISKPIAAILILNTLANTGGSVVASSAFIDMFGTSYLWIFSLGMTLAILFGTEIMPKVIGVEYGKYLLGKLVLPLLFFTKFFAPVIILTEWAAKPFKRSGGSTANDNSVSAADIIAFASSARSRKSIDMEQETIIVNAIKLKHATVQKVMIPREDIQFIINGTSLEENEERFGGVLEKTRYPVCTSNDLDTIIGTINYKKFELRHGDQARDYTSMTREAVYVNEDMTLLQALKMMRWNKRHMLFVQNSETNKLSGLITLEDIMDELVDVALPD
ncbi:MAG: DUF21 domain-containing protein [Lentisphaeria bacterium]|nr:DUF21 domain-containing protein [Lentisphaeria bacterium]